MSAPRDTDLAAPQTATFVSSSGPLRIDHGHLMECSGNRASCEAVGLPVHECAAPRETAAAPRIDAAWKAVAEVPGWVLATVERWYADPHPKAWCVGAFRLRADGSWQGNGRQEAFGPTPADALNALAARLSASGPTE